MTVSRTLQQQFVAARNVNGVPTFVAAADGAATLLTNANANLDWNSMPAGRWTEVPMGATGIVMGLIGNHETDPDDLGCVTRLWAYHDKGPALLIGEITWTIGKRPMVRFPYPPDQDGVLDTAKWADTASITDEQFIHAPVVKNSESDDICLVTVHMGGAKRILVEVTSLDAGLSVMPVFTYYNA